MLSAGRFDKTGGWGSGWGKLSYATTCGLPRLLQWLPESARYDVLTGNQEKAIATLKRIATENGAPMPLGKLIMSRQVSLEKGLHGRPKSWGGRDGNDLS